MSTGIVLIATSHPYYGRMAYNLVVSIRATGSNIPVVLLCNQKGISHLNEQQLSVFTNIQHIDQQAFTAKLHLFDLSPFDNTLYMDCDTAWFPQRTPDELLAQIPEQAQFEIIVEGYYDPITNENKLNGVYNLWADIEEIKQQYQLKGKLYQFRSEMMFFKKTDAVRQLFARAIEIASNPAVTVNQFGGYVPDEFALNIAAAELGLQPESENWKPTYWFNIVKKMIPMPILAKQYFVLSVGGNFVNPSIRKYYNSIMASAFHKLRLQYLYTLQSKKDSIKERYIA